MIRIHHATISDLEELCRLFDAYRIFYGKASDIEGARKFLAQRITKEESEIFIAKKKLGISTGFVQLYPLFSSTRMRKWWLLNDLYVDPEFRGQGISKLLIERAKQLAQSTGAAGLSLETEKTNAIGNQLYPTTGFKLNTEHNFYFWTVK